MQMFASTTIAAPSIVAAQNVAAGPAQKPLDIKSARPELRDAIWVFESAYEAAMEAGKAHLVAFDLYCQWEKKNPRPGAPRAYRKWERRSDRYSEEIGIDRTHEAWDTALSTYREAQLALGKVRALDFTELALKSAAAVAYESGAVDGDKGHDVQRLLRYQGQIVSCSVARDTLLLATGDAAGSAVFGGPGRCA